MSIERALIGIDASRSYREPMTGTERYSRRIIEHLLREHPEDFRYRLYFNDRPPDSAVLGEAEIRELPARRLWTHLTLSRELRANPVDALFVPSHVIPLYHPQRSIVTIHDLGFYYEPEKHTIGTRIQLRATTSWNIRQACRLIAISDSTKKDMVERYGVDPDRVTVVHHGVDDQFRQVNQDEVERYRRAARLPERFILYLGTIQPRKNLERLIDAFELIAGADPGLHLILAGNPGWMAQPIRKRALASAYSRRISFPGRIPDEQLPLLYNAASVFTLPSLYEGFGLPVLEAMACGKPVVMSNRGALPELSGADTTVIDPLDVGDLADALRSTIDADPGNEQVQARIEHARRFSWADSARRTRDVLRRAVDET